MKIHALLGVLLCAVVLVPAASNTAQARSLGCYGAILVKVTNGVDKDGRSFIMHPSAGRKVAVGLEGRKSCKIPRKKCWHSARDRLIRCARALWATRWQRTIPVDHCSVRRPSAYGRPPHGGIFVWHQRYHGDIKRTLEYKACCVISPQARELGFFVILKVHSSDHRHCRHQSTLSSSYKANCTQLRAQGLC